MADPTASELAAQLTTLYVLAEQQFLAGGTKALRKGATLADQLAAAATLRDLAHQISVQLAKTTNPLIVAMVRAAITAGRDTASQQVSKALEHVSAGGAGGDHLPPSKALVAGGEPFDLSLGHGERAARAIIRDLTSELQDVRFRITRLPDDIYKAIAPHGAIYQVHRNAFTPAQAQAAAWRVFVSQGVRGFTDKSGRDWSLSAYTEMAVRTAAMRAYNTSHQERMQALGVHLFTLPFHPGSCPLCFPWQGRVISDGTVPGHPTIADAVAAGCFHPNCEHTLIPYFEGITKVDPQEWTDENAAQFAATQKQRRLELGVRKAKRQLEYSYDPQERADARAEVLAAQRKVRQFVNANPNLHRQSRREQLDLRDGFAKMPTPIR
jgi:hypothetical protein